MNNEYDFDTLAVRAGQQRSQFNEHSEALYLTSSYVFDSAEQAAARFSGTEPLLRVMVEGSEQAQINQIADRIVSAIRSELG